MTDQVFEWIDKPKRKAVTSTLTMLEVLVQPYRLSNINLVNQFYALLSSYPNLEWIPPNLTIADRAARLRAKHHLRTLDAIQVATALEYQASGFISNDDDFRRVEGIEVLVLYDWKNTS